MFRSKKTRAEGGGGADAAAGGRYRAKRWVGAFCLLVWAMLATWFLIPAMLGNLGRFLVYESDDFSTVDAVVLLPGSVPDRAFQAAELFRGSRAQRILLIQDGPSASHNLLKQIGIEQALHWEINRQVLLARGVPENRIEMLDGASFSTGDDARVLRNYLSQHPLDSVALVTCPYHARRAYWNFNRELDGAGLKIYSAPSRYCEFDPIGWWKNRDQFLLVYVELPKLLAFLAGKS